MFRETTDQTTKGSSTRVPRERKAVHWTEMCEFWANQL